MLVFQVVICVDGFFVYVLVFWGEYFIFNLLLLDVLDKFFQLVGLGLFFEQVEYWLDFWIWEEWEGYQFFDVFVNGIVVYVCFLEVKFLYFKVKNGKKGVNKVQ